VTAEDCSKVNAFAEFNKIRENTLSTIELQTGHTAFTWELVKRIPMTSWFSSKCQFANITKTDCACETARSTPQSQGLEEKAHGEIMDLWCVEVRIMPSAEENGRSHVLIYALMRGLKDV